MSANLFGRVEAWIADDPDEETASELSNLLAQARAKKSGPGPRSELEDRFDGLLQFGTAGLRGTLGGGSNRMNRAVVIRAAAGLSQYMTDALAGPGRVVIGYDARFKSDQFALDTAAVMAAAGHDTLLLPSALPTPLVAYAVRALSADAGVMVTASHNPPQDNGYKVYLGGRIVNDAGQGAQIVPPHDAAIASRIEDITSVESVARADAGWTVLGENVAENYVHTAAACVAPLTDENKSTRATTRIVVTPLHGVGGATILAALKEAGFTDLHMVAEQADPDPAFPTVAFPNPEEKGAMDLALALADQVNADVVIANDPDADRCAVATKLHGRWTTLHGDQIGGLLGEHIASHGARLRMAPGSQTLASSIVSSQLLAKIAHAHGHRYEATLTGFKWISRAPGLIFGYEEALGYCVDPAVVRDKDGISAAVVIAEMVASLKSKNNTLADALGFISQTYGHHLSRQVAARFDNTETVQSTMKALLTHPPTSLGGSPVDSTDDMSKGIDGLPGTTGLRLTTRSGARVIIRPSGTEPKVKAYLEVIVPVDGSDIARAEAIAQTLMAELESDVHSALGL